MEQIVLKLLALIGVITIIGAIAFYQWFIKDYNRPRQTKYPWGRNGNWYLGGKPKEVNERIRE